MEKTVAILPVEDDTLLNDMTKRVLTQSGYTVTSAYSGSEALLLMEKQRFDIILLDLMLPGISGETVLARIKENWDIPVILVSAKADIDSKVSLMRNGAVGSFALLIFLYIYLTRISDALDLSYSLYQFWVVGLSNELKIGQYLHQLLPVIMTILGYILAPTAIAYFLFCRMDLRRAERR